jgi:dihydropteroate synthase
MPSTLEIQAKINDKLSQRFIALDPSGYFIIYIDPEAALIYAKHFTNTINEKGLAIDPETGKPFPTCGKVDREPTAIFKAATAKELCIQLFEDPDISLVTKFDHAAYLGRELMRAEIALAMGQPYIQD